MKREAWSAGYTSSYFSFKNFDNARSDEVHAGYANEIRPNLKFNLTVGLTNTKSQSAGGYFGYTTSANLQKILQANAFTLFYTQTSGQTSGLGSVSDNRSAGLSWNHRTRTLSEFVDIFWFDTRPILGNSFSTSGFSAAANVGMPLSRRWSLQGGGQYQRYDNKSAFGIQSKTPVRLAPVYRSGLVDLLPVNRIPICLDKLLPRSADGSFAGSARRRAGRRRRAFAARGNSGSGHGAAHNSDNGNQLFVSSASRDIRL